MVDLIINTQKYISYMPSIVAVPIWRFHRSAQKHSRQLYTVQMEVVHSIQLHGRTRSAKCPVWGWEELKSGPDTASMEEGVQHTLGLAK